jgi:hypothetical protein
VGHRPSPIPPPFALLSVPVPPSAGLPSADAWERVASRERRGRSRLAAIANSPLAANICAARRRPAACRCRRGKLRRASTTGWLVSQRSRRADGGVRVCRTAQALRWQLQGMAVASHELHTVCSSRCDRDAPVAAHPCAAQRRPSVGCRSAPRAAHTPAARRRP